MPRVRDERVTLTEPPNLRVWRRIEAAVAAARGELIRDLEGLANHRVFALAPSDVVESLLGCVAGGALDLRRLELESMANRKAAGDARESLGRYDDPACGEILILKRLTAAAWRDIQNACEERFSEIVLPELLGCDTAFGAIRAVRGLRGISMALDRGTRVVDLRALADLSRPIHVEIRCPATVDVEVIAPRGLTVSAELAGDILLAMSRVGGVQVDAVGTDELGVTRYRLTSNDVQLPVAQEAAVPIASRRHPAAATFRTAATDGKRPSWPAKVWEFFTNPSGGQRDATPTAIVKDECFANLEDALIRASRVVLNGDVRRDIRCLALQILESVHAGSVDMTASESVGRRMISMKHEGWEALDTWCRAKYGTGIRSIAMPGCLSNFRNNEAFLANLKQLSDLRVVQFGEGAARLAWGVN
ncbi:MAG TPA: hypothetical protein VHA82_14455 [Ramlibacter sp.]|uniref:hypothetical protein n=1 Tax=Ramlibacter sp. TaxID=1917967 RepID=UPI002CA21FCB|nr:hypothetical protein [Ramlibacter sp.]HVZ45008.1 hypothetical protein [Ramlibacter sp.]